MRHPNERKVSFQRELRVFLMSTHTDLETRQLVEHVLGNNALSKLPSAKSSLADVVASAVALFDRENVLDNSFFQELAGKFPRRLNEIEELRCGAEERRLPADAKANLDPSAQSRASKVAELERLLLLRERSTAFDQDLKSQIEQLVHEIREGLEFRRGSQVAGTELIKVIGTGNFGTIWLSRDLETGEDRATKVFHLNRLSEGLMLWRYRRSIRAMKLLRDHRETPPTVVRIHEASIDTLAFSMEFLDHGNLENIARRGWTLGRKIDVFLDICRAVAFAHAVGVIHRDIKPANVVMDSTRGPVLTDFDISDIKFVTSLSVAEGSLGTPVFAAPEQLDESRESDERADVYSLGRLLYFFLLERSPGYEIERDPSLKRLSQIPASITTVIRKATQWEPNRRYNSVAGLMQELRDYQSLGASVRARIGEVRRWSRRNTWLLSTSMLAVASLSGFASYQGTVAHEQELLANEARQERDKAKNARLEAEKASHALGEAIDDLEKTRKKLEELADKERTLTGQIAQYETKLLVLNENLPTLKGIEQNKAVERKIMLERELEALKNLQHQLDMELLDARKEVEKKVRAAKEARLRVARSLRNSQVPTLAESPLEEQGDTAHTKDIKCGDNVCDVADGESVRNCTRDCVFGSDLFEAKVDSSCGDLECDGDEDCKRCPADCACPFGLECKKTGSKYLCMAPLTTRARGD